MKIEKKNCKKLQTTIEYTDCFESKTVSRPESCWKQRYI